MFSYNADNTEPNKYSGYVYDAVWLYALALDTLIRNGGPADSVQNFFFFFSRAGISKNYGATNSGSPVAELRFCPWLMLFNN